MIIEIELAIIILLLANAPTASWWGTRQKRLRKDEELRMLAAEHAENEKMKLAIQREHHEQA